MEILVLVSDARDQYQNRVESLTGDSGSVIGTIGYGGGSVPLGQFDMGTFVADSSGSQTLGLNAAGANTNSAQINGLVLRDVTPEPAFLGFVARGGVAILFAKRFRPAHRC